MEDHQKTKNNIEKTIKSLEEKGYEVSLVKSGSEALKEIVKTIPEGSSVTNGSSVTLEQIGYIDLVENEKQNWLDLGTKIRKEEDQEKRAKMRKDSSISDYYVGSVHALIENGDYLVASNTGSQLPHIVFTSNLIFVISTKKIVSNLSEAMQRLTEIVVPLEDEHMKKLYGTGTMLNKIVVSKGEAPMIGRKVKFILVEEDLGF